MKENIQCDGKGGNGCAISYRYMLLILGCSHLYIYLYIYIIFFIIKLFTCAFYASCFSLGLYLCAPKIQQQSTNNQITPEEKKTQE